MGLGGVDAIQGIDSDNEDHVLLSNRKPGRVDVNEPHHPPTHQTNASEGQGLTSLLGDITERVMVSFLGEGSFDPYETNFNLPHMTTILISNESSMDVDG